jgi:hypothetical protein
MAAAGHHLATRVDAASGGEENKENTLLSQVVLERSQMAQMDQNSPLTRTTWSTLLSKKGDRVIENDPSNIMTGDIKRTAWANGVKPTKSASRDGKESTAVKVWVCTPL